MKLTLTSKESTFKQIKIKSKDSSHIPIHVVYGGAHLFKKNTITKLCDLSLKHFEKFYKSPQMICEIFTNDKWDNITDEKKEFFVKIYSKVYDKLKTNHIEDFRIDFEDGFGVRSDTEEDEWAIKASNELSLCIKENLKSSLIGIRIKSFSETTYKRSLRTLDLFVTNLKRNLKNFELIVTLPKVSSILEVKQILKVLNLLEKKLKLKKDSLKLELMIEGPGSIIAEGNFLVSEILKLKNSRLKAFHFGTYDFTSSLEVNPKKQKMDHFFCDLAKALVKFQLDDSQVYFSDGATNILPIGNVEEIYKAHKLSFKEITHSLDFGIFCGWDLHPHQIPIRYIAHFFYYLENLDEMKKRLASFEENKNKATLTGSIFDDEASVRGLRNYFERVKALT